MVVYEGLPMSKKLRKIIAFILIAGVGLTIYFLVVFYQSFTSKDVSKAPKTPPSVQTPAPTPPLKAEKGTISEISQTSITLMTEAKQKLTYKLSAAITVSKEENKSLVSKKSSTPSPTLSSPSPLGEDFLVTKQLSLEELKVGDLVVLSLYWTGKEYVVTHILLE